MVILMKLSELETPALILDLDVMEQNMAKMDSLLAGTQMRLRPHYKSNKCPAIAHLQLAAGAKGICCSKLSEAEDLAFSGIEDILIANQIADRGKIARLASLSRCCRLTVCVDNAENIQDLQNACALQDAQLHCLIEYEIGMNRCGVSEPAQVLALAEQLSACPNLTYDGIQAYAGNLAHEEDAAVRQRKSDEVEQRLRELKAYLIEHGKPAREFSGTSTGTVAMRQKQTVYTEVQAGSYLFMDMAYRKVGAPFSHSLFVLASVMDKRDDAVITDAGAKSVSVDQKTPAFFGYEDLPVEMSEEHSAVYAPLPLRVGDRMKLIPGHCCTTINLHDWLYFVRGDKVVDRVPIVGRGHSL